MSDQQHVTAKRSSSCVNLSLSSYARCRCADVNQVSHPEEMWTLTLSSAVTAGEYIMKCVQHSHRLLFVGCL